MSMLFNCCCQKTCSRQWMPRDAIDREIFVEGCSVRFDGSPFAPLNNFGIGVQGYPQEGIYGPFTDIDPFTDPANWFGRDPSRAEQFNLKLFIDLSTRVFGHTFGSDPVFGTDLPLSVPLGQVEFGEHRVPPSCFLVWEGDSVFSTRTTSYPPENAEPDTITWNDVVTSTGPYKYTHRRIIPCKGVSTGAFYDDPDDLPKTYAELAAAGGALFDTQVAVFYGAVGPGPAPILSVDYTHHFPWFPLTGEPWKPRRDTRTMPPFMASRSVVENFVYRPVLHFQNGEVFLAVKAEAGCDPFLDSWKQLEWGSPAVTYTGKELPGGTPLSSLPVSINNGYPPAITTYVNAGFTTYAIAFDAEWNADTLGIYRATSDTQTHLATFIGQLGDPQPVGVTELETPISYLHPFTGPSSNISRVAQILPEYICDHEWGVSFISVSRPSLFGLNIRNTQIMTTGFNLSIYDEDHENLLDWRRPPHFGGNMLPRPPFVDVLGSTSASSVCLIAPPSYGPYSGFVAQHGGGTIRPLWSLQAVGNGTFVRREV